MSIITANNKPSEKLLLFGKSKCCYLWYTYTEFISFGCSRIM